MLDPQDPSLTFRQIGRSIGVPDPDPGAAEWPLELWYVSIIDVPLGEMPIWDLCRACGQQLFLEFVVPRALGVLEQDPLAGELYQGQLLSSLTGLFDDYWLAHPEEARRVRRILEEVIRQYPDEVLEVLDDLQRLKARIQRLFP